MYKKLDTVYLFSLKQTLQYRDNRSIKKFLRTYGVEIHKEENTNRYYVFKIQLERAQLQQRITALKNKYGNDWLNVINAEIALCTQYKNALNEIQQDQKLPNKIKVKPEHPKSRVADKFLSDLTSNLAEL